MNKTEIEVRFLNIDKNDLLRKLSSLDAQNQGEKTLNEIIFYDQNLTWLDEKRFVRLRTFGNTTKLTYKQNREQKIDSAQEIEFDVLDQNVTRQFLEKIGLKAYRFQEKKRHTFVWHDITIDIDTWPRIPTYVELEGPSEESLKLLAEKLGFIWKNAVFEDAKHIIEERYHIPVGKMTYFTFDRCE